MNNQSYECDIRVKDEIMKKALFWHGVIRYRDLLDKNGENLNKNINYNNSKKKWLIIQYII